MAYDYNIRGWLLGVNRAYVADVLSAGGAGWDEGFTTPPPTPGAGRYFGFDLGYDKDGIIGNYTGHQLNGNIGGMVWKSAHDAQIRKYDFTYDAVNRLTGADFNEWTSGGGYNTFDKTHGIDFSVSNLTYDANGNILHMDQMGLKPGGTSPVDQLVYTYNTNSNKYRRLWIMPTTTQVPWAILNTTLHPKQRPIIVTTEMAI